jgi:hypothetical protein
MGMSKKHEPKQAVLMRIKISEILIKLLRSVTNIE